MTDLAELAARGLRQHLDGVECAPVPSSRRDDAIAALQTAIAAHARRRAVVRFGQRVCCAALVASFAAAWALDDREPSTTILLRTTRITAYHNRVEIQLVDGARVNVDPAEPGTLLLSQGSLIARVPQGAAFGPLRVRTPHAAIETRDAAALTIQVSLARSACGDSVTRVDVRLGVLSLQATRGEPVQLTAPASWQSCEP